MNERMTARERVDMAADGCIHPNLWVCKACYESALIAHARQEVERFRERAAKKCKECSYFLDCKEGALQCMSVIESMPLEANA